MAETYRGKCSQSPRRDYNRERRERRRTQGLCVICGKRKIKQGSRSNCATCLRRARGNYHKRGVSLFDREARNEYQRLMREALRRNALNAYGGPTCACCGEDIEEFLEIDHIYGDGRKHRAELAKRGSYFYYWLKKNNYPEGFQVLCSNCNKAMYTFGECPHEEERP